MNTLAKGFEWPSLQDLIDRAAADSSVAWTWIVVGTLCAGAFLVVIWTRPRPRNQPRKRTNKLPLSVLIMVPLLAGGAMACIGIGVAGLVDLKT